MADNQEEWLEARKRNERQEKGRKGSREMKEIKREDLKVGDEVCILLSASIGWNHFKYGKIKRVKIEKISPKRISIIANGRQMNKYERFYELDDDILHKDSVTRSLENIFHKIYKIYNEEGEVTQLGDEDIKKLSNILDSAYDVMKGGN